MPVLRTGYKNDPKSMVRECMFWCVLGWLGTFLISEIWKKKAGNPVCVGIHTVLLKAQPYPGNFIPPMRRCPTGGKYIKRY